MNWLKIIETELRYLVAGVILLVGYTLATLGDEIVSFACWAAGVEREDNGPTDDEDPFA